MTSSSPNTANPKRWAKVVVGNANDRAGERVRSLHVDVVAGDPDVISEVIFRAGGKVSKSRCPARVLHHNGRTRWRFSGPPAAAAAGSVQVVVVGRGRTALRRYFRAAALRPVGGRGRHLYFFDPRADGMNPLRPVPMPDVNFGIELELTCADTHSAAEVASSLSSRASVDVRDMTADYGLASDSHSVWRCMSDASIVCHRDMPDCSRFELVSRILRGSRGLHECHRVVEGLSFLDSVRVNKSMGFHVHVDVSSLSLPELIRVCQTFVAFEGAIDSFMPPSRRASVNRYCRSNRAVVGDADAECHDRLAACRTMTELADAMNPEQVRYFKLNLQNLRDGRQPTVEFRQHSATSDAEKVNRWVRFCVSLVRNSSALPSDDGPMDGEFESLFELVVRDRCLRDFYRERRDKLTIVGGEDRAGNAAAECAPRRCGGGGDARPESDGRRAPPCRLPARLSASERGRVQRNVSLENRAAYFEASACPIAASAERQMEAISGAVSREALAERWERGRYDCARCGRGLYSSRDKFRGPCIWPSFRGPRHLTSLHAIFLPTGSYHEYECDVHELYCGGCRLFLGHQFADGRESGDNHPEAGDRHCILSLSLKFVPMSA